MASTLISNTYVGDGSTVLYSFTFPYIEITDVRVSLDGTETTEFIFANATTIQFNTAPALNQEIVIFRNTDNTELKAVFFPGSAIRSRDLNDNFTQSLYVVQEATLNVSTAETDAARAIAIAEGADTKSNTAIGDAASATQTANDALSAASGAESSANQAAIDATAAQAAAASAETQAIAAATEATASSVAAAAAQQAAQDAADAVSSGPVASVNGQQGIVVLGLTDLSDVDTSSVDHTPTDGQSLVWSQSMGHWMPSDASLNIGSLPTLP